MPVMTSGSLISLAQANLPHRAVRIKPYIGHPDLTAIGTRKSLVKCFLETVLGGCFLALLFRVSGLKITFQALCLSWCVCLCVGVCDGIPHCPFELLKAAGMIPSIQS